MSEFSLSDPDTIGANGHGLSGMFGDNEDEEVGEDGDSDK